MQNPFRCFNSSPEVIRLAVMMYIRYPLSLRQVEDLLFERGINPGFPRWIANLMTDLGDSAIRINAIPSSQRSKPVSPGG